MLTVLFSQLSAEDPAAYVEAKLHAWVQRTLGPEVDADLPRLAAETGRAAAALTAEPVQLAGPDGLPELDRRERVRIEARKRCLLDLVAQALPLGDGEAVQEDFFSYITREHEGLPAGAVVLRRRTDRATLYIFPHGWSVDGAVLRFQPPPTPIAAPDRLATAAPSVTAGSLAMSLAEAAASTLGGKIGALVFSQIFPPSVPSYFDEVYKQVEQIMKQQLVQTKIDEINGTLDGLQQWVRNRYTTDKESGKSSRQELTDLLSPKVDELSIKALGVLREKAYAATGLTAFMVGAGMHLTLLQELALVDPKESDPEASALAKSVELYAADHSSHARTTFDAIVEKRRSYVRLMSDPLVVCSGARCQTKGGYRYKDDLTGTMGRRHEEYDDADKNHHSGSEEATADMNTYVSGVVGQLTLDLSDPKAVAAEWDKLKTAPIPQAAGS